MHRNARLTPEGRRILCERIASGRPAAHVAAEMGVSRTTAYRWWRRYQPEGLSGLYDRSSRPHISPNRTNVKVESRYARFDGVAGSAPKPAQPAVVDGPSHREGDPPLREGHSR